MVGADIAITCRYRAYRLNALLHARCCLRQSSSLLEIDTSLGKQERRNNKRSMRTTKGARSHPFANVFQTDGVPQRKPCTTSLDHRLVFITHIRSACAVLSQIRILGEVQSSLREKRSKHLGKSLRSRSWRRGGAKGRLATISPHSSNFPKP